MTPPLPPPRIILACTVVDRGVEAVLKPGQATMLFIIRGVEYCLPVKKGKDEK